jgi:hypothetical protein
MQIEILALEKQSTEQKLRKQALEKQCIEIQENLTSFLIDNDVHKTQEGYDEYQKLQLKKNSYSEQSEGFECAQKEHMEAQSEFHRLQNKVEDFLKNNPTLGRTTFSAFEKDNRYKKDLEQSYEDIQKKLAQYQKEPYLKQKKRCFKNKFSIIRFNSSMK